MLATVLGWSVSSLLLWSGPPVLPPDTRAPAALPAAKPEPSPPTSPSQPAEPSDELSEVPSPEPSGAAPVAAEPSGAAPVAAEPSGAAPADPFIAPDVELAASPSRTVEPGYVVVQRPRRRGTGMFITGGALMGSAFLFQLLDGLLCGNCGIGIFERSALGSSMALAAGGGVMRAHADAYDDAALRRTPRDTRRVLIAGATLTGVGAVLGLVNDGLWWRCVINESGPYALTDETFFSYDCRYGISRALLDVASMTTATGLGLLSYSLTYRRDAKAYQRARVIGLRPTVGRDRFTLAVQGRF